jgi:hypothetical protein
VTVPSPRIRFRRWRVRQAGRLFARSRTARLLAAAAVFPVVRAADWWQHVAPPAQWSTSMDWVRTGVGVREPATSAQPRKDDR